MGAQEAHAGGRERQRRLRVLRLRLEGYARPATGRDLAALEHAVRDGLLEVGGADGRVALADRDHAALEVDVGPGEPEGLALAQPEVQADLVERLVLVAFELREERVRLLGVVDDENPFSFTHRRETLRPHDARRHVNPALARLPRMLESCPSIATILRGAPSPPAR